MAWEEAFCSHYSIDELPISGRHHSAVLLEILGDPRQPLPLAVAAYLTVHSLRSASTARRSIDVSGFFRIAHGLLSIQEGLLPVSHTMRTRI